MQSRSCSRSLAAMDRSGVGNNAGGGDRERAGDTVGRPGGKPEHVQ